MGNKDMPAWPTPPGDMAGEDDEYRYVLESYRAAMWRLRVAVEALENIRESSYADDDGIFRTSTRTVKAGMAIEALAAIGPLPELPELPTGTGE